MVFTDDVKLNEKRVYGVFFVCLGQLKKMVNNTKLPIPEIIGIIWCIHCLMLEDFVIKNLFSITCRYVL